MNGVTESLVFSERSANKLYMYILGFEAMQYSSGTSWTLSVLVVLISKSITAQLLGGSFVLFFSETAALLYPDSPPFMGGLLGPRTVRVSGTAETE